MVRLFLDANVYFAGFYSEKGASALLLEIIERRKIPAFASRLVLLEADRNLRQKATSSALKSFRRYLQQNKIHVVPSPDEKVTAPFEPYLHPKDLPVLGAALIAKADYLITLDQRHFFNEQLVSRLKQPKILTPGDFLQNVYLKGKI